LPFSRIGKSYIWLEVDSKSSLASGKNRNESGEYRDLSLALKFFLRSD
jgi:hypothetical protein